MQQEFSMLNSLLQGSPLAIVLAIGLVVLWRTMEKKDAIMEKKDAAILGLTGKTVEVIERNTAQMKEMTAAIRESHCPYHSEAESTSDKIERWRMRT
jgi:hypothetical protein